MRRKTEAEVRNSGSGDGRGRALGWRVLRTVLATITVAAWVSGCGGGDEEGAGESSGTEQGGGEQSRAGGPPSGRPSGGRPGGGRPGGGPPGGFGGMGMGGPGGSSEIPVEVGAVEVLSIGDYLETNGLLEAENEVDLIARTGGPIVELLAEEGQFVQEGQLLARIDADELRARYEISKVNVEETRVNFERARRSLEEELISEEIYDQTKARYDSAQAQLRGDEIQLAYTEIRAPFSGLIIERVIRLASFVNNGERLFRISDFDPLLCRIQIPEKDLTRLEVGQPAKIRVEAFRDREFRASVLRINPVIDSTSGTVRVTLAVRGQGKLRPGMFASVYLETDRHDDALVIPRRALVLESLGDTVYVVDQETAQRREVTVGFSEDELIEVTSGLEAGEKVVLVGQDALTDGVGVNVLRELPGSGDDDGTASRSRGGIAPSAGGADQNASSPGTASAGGSGPRGGPFAGGGPPDLDDPAVVERMRERMRSRGLTEDQIDQRIEQFKKNGFPGRPGGQGPPGSSR